MKPTFGSLFAGVGGFDMGFEQAEWECKFQVEWDKYCRSILDKHWPDVEKWGDICNVNGRFLPPVDCIIFGSPCQDLSQAGLRQGLSGKRSVLFHEAIRIIKEMKDATGGTFPRWTIWENVAGALSSNNGHDFATVINEMAKAGACLQEYALLDAQHFGIPNDAGACSSSLALILQHPSDVQARYYLSPKACEGILRRANRRGKVLPARLQTALEAMVESSDQKS